MKALLKFGAQEVSVDIRGSHLLKGVSQEFLNQGNPSALLLHVLSGLKAHQATCIAEEQTFLTPFVDDLAKLQKEWDKREEDSVLPLEQAAKERILGTKKETKQ